MTIPAGHRFEATQALRQVLARAVSWGLIDSNPAKQRVDNPQRRRTEKRPFESWAELEALATELGPRRGPLVLFAAATGLRPGEWIALEHRDIDRDARVVYVRRAYRNGRVEWPKTEASSRAVPLQTIGSPLSSGCRQTGGRRWCFRRQVAAISIFLGIERLGHPIAATMAAQKSSLRPVDPLTRPRSSMTSSSNGSVGVPPSSRSISPLIWPGFLAIALPSCP
jgi:integrase